MDETVSAGSTENTEGQEVGKVTGIPDNYQPNVSEDMGEEKENTSGVENVEEKPESNPIPENQWYLREGVIGSGDRPEFLLEKYGFNLEKQAMAYPDAEKKMHEQSQKLGAFTGAPDKYDFSSAEDESFKFDEQDKVFGEFVTECKNNNISQEFAAKIAVLGRQMIESPVINTQEERKNYGSSFDSDNKHIQNWITNNVESDNDAKDLAKSVQTAGSLRALKSLMDANGFSIPGNEIPTAPKETLKDMQRNFSANIYDGDKIAENPEKALEWAEKFKKFSSGKA